MKIEGIISIINTLCKSNSFSKARPIIINEWKRLTESRNYHLLNTSAQEFIKIINSEKEDGRFEVLSHADKRTLNVINESVKQAQFRYARQIMSEHHALLEKPLAQKWLTQDAKIIYDAWKTSFNLEFTLCTDSDFSNSFSLSDEKISK
ncbi:hypothetical protein [Neobacillus sp. D3-1R]|uniref:hypothetical protein n=1 Tax=Neobacillus sp. D3-1R TaxID=3445778 RepID=UPI003FA11715